MIIALTVCVVLLALIALMFFYLWRAERHRRAEPQKTRLLTSVEVEPEGELINFDFGGRHMP